MFSGERRRNQYWRIFQEKDSCAGLIDKLQDHLFLIAFGSNQIPFVQNNNRGFPLFLDQTGDTFVLRGGTRRKIDNKHAEIGAPNASFRTHDAENFNRAGMSTASADSSGVDKEKLSTVLSIRNVDGVTSCSWQLAHDGTLALRDRIDQ